MPSEELFGRQCLCKGRAGDKESSHSEDTNKQNLGAFILESDHKMPQELKVSYEKQWNDKENHSRLSSMKSFIF